MSLISTPTKLELEGIGTFTVRPNDYLTQGGEGVIYRKGNHVLKLAFDVKKLQQSGMPEKVKLLRNRLSHPSIITPQGIVYDEKGQPIGYHLPFVTGDPYPRLFTNDWRQQHGFTDDSVTHLASTMHELVAHAHQANALMVDANELNWLADVSNVRQPTPYVIDVDSWQIDRFKASVIMPSIRDWHGPIAETSDWFAWGIVTFLLYTGVHPYKGHFDGYRPGELERRMKDNVSVFHQGVRVNKAVRDFSVIPGPLLDWYRATFELGERTLPPSPKATGQANTTLGRVLRTVTTATGNLVYELLLQIPGETITSIWPCGVVKTDQGNLIEITTKKIIAKVEGSRVAVVARDGGWIIAEIINQNWQFWFVERSGQKQELKITLPIIEVIRSGERLFVTTETELVELTLQHFNQPILLLGRRWQILGNSTRWWNGVGISDVLGAIHLIIPNGEDAVAIVRLPELDVQRIVNAKAFGRIASVVTLNQQGQYQVFDLAGGPDWKSYQVSVRDTDGPDLNLAILNKSVTADIRQDGELIISVPTQGVVKVVTDKNLSTNMRLGNIGDLVVYRHDTALWSLTMR